MPFHLLHLLLRCCSYCLPLWRRSGNVMQSSEEVCTIRLDYVFVLTSQDPADTPVTGDAQAGTTLVLHLTPSHHHTNAASQHITLHTATPRHHHTTSSSRHASPRPVSVMPSSRHHDAMAHDVHHATKAPHHTAPRATTHHIRSRHQGTRAHRVHHPHRPHRRHPHLCRRSARAAQRIKHRFEFQTHIRDTVV